MNWIELTMDLFLHISFIAVAIPLIYFIYGCHLQLYVVKREISMILIDSLRPFIPSIVKEFENKDIPQYQDEINNPKNIAIKNNAFKYLGLMSLISFIIFIVLAYFNMKQTIYIPGSNMRIFIENIILTIFIIITEVLFFTYIATKYRPINVDKIKEYLIKPFDPNSC